MVNLKKAGTGLLILAFFAFSNSELIASAQTADPTTTTAVTTPTSPDPTSGTTTLTAPTTGGVLVIDAASIGSDALHVTEGTTAVIDFSSGANVSLSGNFTNAGTIYAVSSNPQILTANFTANNIFNQQNALLTTVLPQGGILGLSTLFTPLSLNLTAINNIVNSGTISSAGNLSLVAGGTITNGVTAGAVAAMQAVNNINMQASQIFNNGTIMSQLASINATTASLTNTGTLQAAMGNITVQSLTNSLLVNNTAGSILAGQNLTFQTLDHILNADETPGATLDVIGGTLGANSIFFDSVKGAIKVDVNRIDGVMNASGAMGLVQVKEGDLNMGSLNFTGDPTFFNTGGSVTLGSATTVVGDLAILASQDITVLGLTSAPGSGQNGNMTLIAGANFTAPPSVNTQIGPDAATTLTINGGSATGGAVRVTGDIATNGGNLVVAAYSGSGAGSANAPGTIIITGTTNTSRGNVTMIAGATSGAGITTGDVTSSGTGGSGSAGSITALTVTPVIGGAGTLSVSDGVLTGAFTTSALTSNSASISMGNLLAAGAGGSNGSAGGAGGAVRLQSGNGVATGSIRTFGGGGGGGTNNSTGGAGGAGGTITIANALGQVLINGDMNSSGGGGGAGGVTGGAGGVGGSAAAITVDSGGGIAVSGPILAAGGGAGGSGATDQTGGSGGGGSFGGGGGGTTSIYGIGGGGGGGGFTGGGGGGGGANSFFGGAGGGGGYATGGGGGGAAGQFNPGFLVNYAGGGGGGGGIGYGGGGGAGGSNPCCAGGGAGGSGGGNGSGTNGGSSVGGAGGTGGGGVGGSGLAVNGGGGNGGFGGGVGSGTGGAGSNPVYGLAGAGSGFGVGGTRAASSNASNGGAVGTSGNGAAVTLNGVGAVTLTGTIGGLGTSTGSGGFTGHSYSGDSINTAGATAGNISVNVTTPAPTPVYFADANYGAGAATYAVSTGGISTAGAFRTSGSGTITLNGTTIVGTSIAAATVNTTYGGSSFTIKEQFGATTNNVLISSGSFVTPAEFIALYQVSQGGAAAQTLTISQNASTTSPGTGYASGGNFNVTLANIPGSFTNLVLPASVTQNTSTNVAYSGSATVGGTLNQSAATINVGTTTTVQATGSINFTGPVGTLSSGGLVSGAGTVTGTNLSIVTTNGSIYGPSNITPLNIQASTLRVVAGGAGSSALLANNQAVLLNASGAGGTFNLRNTGTITLNGDINNSSTPGTTVILNALGPSSILRNSGTIYASSDVSLLTGGGNIGSSGTAIQVATPSLVTNTSGTGDAFVTDSMSFLVTTGPGGSVKDLTLTGTAAGGTITVTTPGIASTGNVIIQTALGSNGNIFLDGHITTAANKVVRLTADGTGTINRSLAPTTPKITAGSVFLTTGGGFIGQLTSDILVGASNVNFQTNGAGDVFVFNTNGAAISTNSGSLGSIKSLIYRDDSIASTVTVAPVGINATGDVTILTQSASGISIEGNITAGITKTITLGSSGNASIVENLGGGGTGTLTANRVILDAPGGGNIGAPGNDILVNAGFVVLHTDGTGNAYISASSSVTVSTNAPGVNDLFVTQTGSGSRIIAGSTSLGLLINAAGNVVLQGAPGSNAGIDIEGNVTTASNKQISLLADGSGSITENLLGFGVGTLTAGSVALKGASVGTAGNFVQTNTTNLSANATSGSSFVNDISPGVNTVNNTSPAFSNYAAVDYVLTANGITMADGIGAGTSIQLKSNGPINNPFSKLLNAPEVRLQGQLVGSSPNPIRVQGTSQLTANSTLGGVFVLALGGTPLTLNNGTVAGNAITNHGQTDYSVSSSFGDLLIGGNIDAGNKVILSTTENIFNNGFTISGTGAILTSSGIKDIGTATQSITTAVTNLTVNTMGQAWVQNSNAAGSALVTDSLANRADLGYNVYQTSGDLAISGPVTSNVLIIIQSNGAITNTSSLSAPTVVLSASNDIGSSALPVNTVAGSITAKSTNGSVYISNAGTSGTPTNLQGYAPLTLSNSANGTFEFTETVAAILVNENLNASTVILKDTAAIAGTNGSILNTAGVKVTATDLVLQSTGDVRAASTGQFLVDSTNLTVRSTGGQADISHVGTGTINLVNNAATGNSNTVGTTYALSTTQASINIVDNVQGITVLLTSAADITATGSGVITGSPILLVASGANGVGSAAAAIKLNGTLTTANAANGSVYISNSAANVQLRVTNSYANYGKNIYSATATNGLITLQNDVSSDTLVFLSAPSANGNINNTAQKSVNSPTVALWAGGSTGVGATLSPVLTNASQLNAISFGSGAVFVTATNAAGVALVDYTGQSNSGSSGYTLTVPSGGISINGNVSAASGNIYLQAADATTGNIFTNGAGTITITGGTSYGLVLSANGTTGIGTSAQPLLTSVNKLTASAPNGEIYINNSSSPILLLQNSVTYGLTNTAAGTFNLNMTGGAISVEGNISAGQFAPGFVTPNPLVPIPVSAIQTDGQIYLNATTSITFATGVSLIARGGIAKSGSVILSSNLNVIGTNPLTIEAWGGDVIVRGDGSGVLQFANGVVIRAIGLDGSPVTTGRVGIANGMSVAQVTTQLDTLTTARSNPGTLSVLNGSIFTGNTVTFTGGGNITVDASNVTNNNLTASGGVIFLKSAVLTGSTIESYAPAIPLTPELTSAVVSKSTPITVTIPTSTSRVTFFVPSFAPLIGNTLAPTDKTPVLKGINNDVDNQLAPLQGFLNADEQDELGSAMFFQDNFDGADLAQLSKFGVKFGKNTGKNFLNLDQGKVLFASNNDLVVQTHEGTVYIPAGAIAMVYETGNDVAVYDLVDTHTKPVKVESNGNVLELNPGQQIVLTKVKNPSFDAVNPATQIAYRNIESHDMGAGITAFVSDFSIVSALTKEEPCKMLRNGGHPLSRQTVSKIMKTAAAVHVINSKKGPYKLKSSAN